MFRQVSCSVPIAQTILLGNVPSAIFQTDPPQRRTACATKDLPAAARGREAGHIFFPRRRAAPHHCELSIALSILPQAPLPAPPQRT